MVEIRRDGLAEWALETPGQRREPALTSPGGTPPIQGAEDERSIGPESPKD